MGGFKMRGVTGYWLLVTGWIGDQSAHTSFFCIWCICAENLTHKRNIDYDFTLLSINRPVTSNLPYHEPISSFLLMELWNRVGYV